jgi:hypothetical protein
VAFLGYRDPHASVLKITDIKEGQCVQVSDHDVKGKEFKCNLKLR